MQVLTLADPPRSMALPEILSQVLNTRLQVLCRFRQVYCLQFAFPDIRIFSFR